MATQRVTAEMAQHAGAEVSHTVFPACACGHAYGAHRCAGWHPLDGVENDACACTLYAPSGQVEELTSVYRPWTTTRGARRWTCLACWWLERQARTLRRRLERRV